MARTNRKYLIIGMTGTGKTVFTKKFIRELLRRGTFQKAIIFDEFESDIWDDMETYDHPEWADTKIPIIPLDKATKLKSGIARIIAEKDDLDYHFKELNKVRNAVILLEDASRSIEAEVKPPKEVMRLFYNVKQVNVDFILVFHSLAEVPKKMFRQVNTIFLFKTGDDKVPDKIKIREITEAYDRLKKSTNPFAKEKITINPN